MDKNYQEKILQSLGDEGRERFTAWLLEGMGIARDHELPTGELLHCANIVWRMRIKADENEVLS